MPTQYSSQLILLAFLPEVPGLDRFRGKTMHSARWDHGYDLRGKRVASIGTGASAIQYVPEIQPEVEQLHVFQRTPPWIVPHTNRPIGDLERRIYRAVPTVQRLVTARSGSPSPASGLAGEALLSSSAPRR